MKIVFSGKSSRMVSAVSTALVGAFLGEWANISNIMLQNKSLSDELKKLLYSKEKNSLLREESSYFALEGMDYLIWQKRNNRLTRENITEVVYRVNEKTSFIPSGERDAPGLYPEETGRLQMDILEILEQLYDLVLLDCGELNDPLMKKLLLSGSICIICFEQKKDMIDQVMLEKNFNEDKVFYIVTNYDYSSVYNKKNIARLYGISEDRIGVIPECQDLEKQLKRGEIGRFVNRNMNAKAGTRNHFFVKEMKECTGKLLSVVNYGA